MARKKIHRIVRGTDARVSGYAGPTGELVMNTGDNSVHLQTGAIGGVKLANDKNVVHISGNEVISGVKTFADAPVIKNGGTTITVPTKDDVTSAINAAISAYKVPKAAPGVIGGVTVPTDGPLAIDSNGVLTVAGAVPAAISLVSAGATGYSGLSVGDQDTPVYFSGGTAKSCNKIATPVATPSTPGGVIVGPDFELDATGVLRQKQEGVLYVAANGNDNNDGLTAATPLRQISTAVKRSFGYGQLTIKIAKGTYSGEGFYPSIYVTDRWFGNGSIVLDFQGDVTISDRWCITYGSWVFYLNGHTLTLPLGCDVTYAECAWFSGAATTGTVVSDTYIACSNGGRLVISPGVTLKVELPLQATEKQTAAQVGSTTDGIKVHKGGRFLTQEGSTVTCNGRFRVLENGFAMLGGDTTAARIECREQSQLFLHYSRFTMGYLYVYRKSHVQIGTRATLLIGGNEETRVSSGIRVSGNSLFEIADGDIAVYVAGTAACMTVEWGGLVYITSNPTHSLHFGVHGSSAAITCSEGTVNVRHTGFLYVGADVVISGNVTGRRYYRGSGGTIDVNSVSNPAERFPGSEDPFDSTTQGGYYGG